MSFITDDFLLENDFAAELYHEHAVKMPIVDYHNHLRPKLIEQNHQYSNLAQLWLDGDHYKWRAMRTLGIDEHFITGKASDEEKFQKWAQTVPFTIRNPLYHWTHLELKRYFGVDELLNPDTANSIYQYTREQLDSGNYKVQDLLKMMNVELLCTTDDPLDNLESHISIIDAQTNTRVLPSFRPDSLLNTSVPHVIQNNYERLSTLTGIEIKSFDDFLNAMELRHHYFHEFGCRLSDYGLDYVPFVNYTSLELNEIVSKIQSGQKIGPEQSDKYVSACLVEFGKIQFRLGWTQQFHLGALRGVNSRMKKLIGADSGFDSIGDFKQASSLAKILDALDIDEQLPKTIIYNLNPSQNEVFASMLGNFNDGKIKGKMQLGSAWWFLDQLDGMEKQINAISNLGLLSCFVGMLTDSRSFLSFPRHEYFRRLLCNILGKEIEKGLVPKDMELVGRLVEDICYNNAKEYFDFN